MLNRYNVAYLLDRMMLKKVVGAVVAGLLMIPAQAIADVSPLGFVIGKASLKDVEDGLPAAATVVESGINKFTMGQMLTVDGNGLEIQGLQTVTFIFTKDDRLDAVTMKMSRGSGVSDDRFNQILKHLSSQYKLVSKNVPFVGNKTAVFRKENVEVTLDSPHMDFSMYVSYITDSFSKRYKEISSAERHQKQQQEKSRF